MVPENFNIAYDEAGNTVAMTINGSEVGTADFQDGAGPVPTTRPASEGLRGSEIGGATRTALHTLEEAFEADMVQKRQRIADELQERADKASAEAQKAQDAATDAADEVSQDVDPPADEV